MDIKTLAGMISKLAPGQRYRVSRSTFRMIRLAPFENNYGFPLQDYVLELIVGSSYEFGYDDFVMQDYIEFFRLKEPLIDGRRTYVSPDQRNAFVKTLSSLYEQNL